MVCGTTHFEINGQRKLSISALWNISSVVVFSGQENFLELFPVLWFKVSAEGVTKTSTWC